MLLETVTAADGTNERTSCLAESEFHPDEVPSNAPAALAVSLNSVAKKIVLRSEKRLITKCYKA
jgi:hypothetical protein